MTFHITELLVYSPSTLAGTDRETSDTPPGVQETVRRAARQSRRRARYAERREHVAAQQRRRYATNPGYRARKHARDAGYQADAVLRAATNARRRVLHRRSPVGRGRADFRILVAESMRAIGRLSVAALRTSFAPAGSARPVKVWREDGRPDAVPRARRGRRSRA